MVPRVFESQDIDVVSPIQSFLSLYIDFYITEEKRFQGRKLVGRHDDAFADSFVAHTRIHIQTLHELCKEILKSQSGMGTSN